MAAYRYAREPFWLTVAIAGGLTLLIAFLTWTVLNVLNVRWADGWTLTAGAIFFVFCSAAMIRAYATGETVVAVQPQGFLDTRVSSEAVPWNEVRRVELVRRETEWHVALYLWSGDGNTPDVMSAIDGLDGGPRAIAEDLADHVPVHVAAA